MGGGRHWLQLNTRTRAELDIAPGDTVRDSLLVPEKPPLPPMQSDLAIALREADLQESFGSLPAGNQNHIVQWIEEAARPQTREKRVEIAIEVAFRSRERAFDKDNRAKMGSR